MSRIGKKSIVLPQAVEAKISGQEVVIKGPKGTLKVLVHKAVSIKQEDGSLVFDIENNNGSNRALWGLNRTLVNNAIVGVTQGFQKQLEINGVGFKVAVSGKKLVLNVGFSHPVDYALPEGIEAAVEKNIIKISGIDKYLVGQVSAEIRAIKKPEPYKGKGIKYIDEHIRRKAGKVVKSA